MAKKNKNSNYVTEKTLSAQKKKQQAKRSKETKKKVLAVVISVLVLLLIGALIFGLFSAAKYSAENSTDTSIAHDHDGDGVPDHDDSYHTHGGGSED